MLTCHLQILFAYGMALYMIQLFLMPATCKHVWRVEEVGMGGSWETVGMQSNRYRYQKVHTKMKNTTERAFGLWKTRFPSLITLVRSAKQQISAWPPLLNSFYIT